MRTITLIVSSALLWSVSWAQQPAQNAPAAASNQAVTDPPALAAASGLAVTDASIAIGLEEYEPIEPGELFPATVKQLYCYSRIKGAQDSMEIQHRWYWNDDLMASIPLKVNSNNWRTYSIKNIHPGMTGEWVVAIVNAHNAEEVLKTMKFTVK
jgi:hypothetical protein